MRPVGIEQLESSKFVGLSYERASSGIESARETVVNPSDRRSMIGDTPEHRQPDWARARTEWMRWAAGCRVSGREFAAETFDRLSVDPLQITTKQVGSDFRDRHVEAADFLHGPL